MEREESRLTAVELFSGIGGWHAAVAGDAQLKGRLRVVGAFDQNCNANRVYQTWHALKPSTKDVCRLAADDFAGIDLLMASPPCQPFTAGGLQKDAQDPRSAALLHLIGIIRDGGAPPFLALENVPLFRSSQCRELLVKALEAQGYSWAEYVVSPHEFGIPNRRLRYYLIASKEARLFPPCLPGQQDDNSGAFPTLRDFVGSDRLDSAIAVPQSWFASEFKFHCVMPESRCVTQCFTKGYLESKNSGGSYLSRELDDELASDVADAELRFFPPSAILALMCFPPHFQFDEERTSIKSQYKLIGNSVNVKVIEKVLHALLDI